MHRASLRSLARRGALKPTLSEQRCQLLSTTSRSIAHVHGRRHGRAGSTSARFGRTPPQDQLNRLDEAFLFDRSIDIETYDRHAEKLREELTLARIDRHSGQVDELDVEGILAFAERILPRASDLWVQASLNQRAVPTTVFPDGLAFDGNRFIGTGVTAPAFSYLREIRVGNERLVDQTGIEPVTS